MKSPIELLEEVISEAGYESRRYSGRFMYGQECIALATEDASFEVKEVLSETAESLYRHKQREVCLNLIRKMQQDSLGLGFIYYWPTVTYARPASE